jgi:hypothetical protein
MTSVSTIAARFYCFPCTFLISDSSQIVLLTFIILLQALRTSLVEQHNSGVRTLEFCFSAHLPKALIAREDTVQRKGQRCVKFSRH